MLVRRLPAEPRTFDLSSVLWAHQRTSGVHWRGGVWMERPTGVFEHRIDLLAGDLFGGRHGRALAGNGIG